VHAAPGAPVELMPKADEPGRGVAGRVALRIDAVVEEAAVARVALRALLQVWFVWRANAGGTQFRIASGMKRAKLCCMRKLVKVLVFAFVACNGPQGPQGPQGVRGDMGAMGLPGDLGPAGDAGPAGAPGLRWRGVWSSSVGYDSGDAVQHAGSSWVSTAAGNVGNMPGAAGAWDLLAAAAGAGAGDGGVSLSQLSTAGASRGHSVMFDGNTAVWGRGQPFASTVVIPSTASATTNGALLVAAVAAPGVSKIVLDTGTYDVGDAGLALGGSIAIEGQGAGTTISSPGQTSAAAATVKITGGNVLLSNLGVQSLGTGAASTAVLATGGFTTFTNVKALAFGDASDSVAIQVGSQAIISYTGGVISATAGGAFQSHGLRAAGFATLNGTSVAAYQNDTAPANALSLDGASEVRLMSCDVFVQSSNGQATGLDARGTAAVRVIGSNFKVVGQGGSGVAVQLADSSQVTVNSGVLEVVASRGDLAHVQAMSTLTLQAVTGLMRMPQVSGCQSHGVTSFGRATIDASTISVTSPAGCMAVGVRSEGAAAQVVVRTSSISVGPAGTALLSTSTTPLRVAATQLTAPTLTVGTAMTCVGAYKGDFTMTTAACN
jgi:hypothetical protein